jgi:uncharacterized protein YecE (DUF72 family)
MFPFVGCAGWAINKQFQAKFPGSGTHLQRYSKQFNAVEINSSFYRPHRTTTYARWADSTPDDFRFAVKMARLITHQCRLRDSHNHVDRFVAEIQGLREKLGPILVQLPPSLKYTSDIVFSFFAHLRQRVSTAIACEARHISWFTSEARDVLKHFDVMPVIADPPITQPEAINVVCTGSCYFRLHGSPQMYYSSYNDAFLTDLAIRIAALTSTGATVWCIFDNTALGAAIENALDLRAKIRARLTRG